MKNQRELTIRDFCVEATSREQAFVHESSPRVGELYKVVSITGRPSPYVANVWEMSVKAELVTSEQRAETNDA